MFFLQIMINQCTLGNLTIFRNKLTELYMMFYRAFKLLLMETDRLKCKCKMLTYNNNELLPVAQRKKHALKPDFFFFLICYSTVTNFTFITFS